jgi:GTP-binding protein
MIKLIEATFLTSAQNLQDSPSPDIAEVVFLGRSNVGKSSLLNSLTKRKKLAKYSSTPGKTQLINYFNIKFKNDNNKSHYLYARFIDLPGFGYAKISKSIKEDWNKNLTNFLEKRASLQIFIHLIDARHTTLNIDKNMNDFLKYIKKADQIILNVFTKIDKLKKNELNKLKHIYPNAIFISNLKNQGIQQLEEKISTYLFQGSINAT